jgi:hypothetical protein
MALPGTGKTLCPLLCPLKEFFGRIWEHLRHSQPERFAYEKAGEGTWDKIGIFVRLSV